MVELWGNTLSFIGSLFGILIDTILFDAFFPRKRPERYYWPLIVTGTFIIFMFSILVGNRFGYTFAILFEIAVYYLLCAFLYQSRWDRRLFVVVTNYAILYSASYWGDALCIFFLDLTYEEYVWNIPLYSVAFILRLLAIFSIALLIQKYHQPLSVGKQARAWVPLSAVFPISTLLIIWQIYTFPHEQQIWQICLLIHNIPKMVSSAPPAKYLTPDALRCLLATPDITTPKGRRHLVLLTVLYDTAARVSELADIRMRDVRLDSPAAITLHGKGGKVRTVPLMKQTVELLQSYFTENGITPQKSPDMPLFWSGNYRKLTRSGITYIVQKYAAAAQAISTDIPATISPHVFRHTKAMHLVQANVNTIYIKDYLGHADISTTEVYARADNEAKRAALEKASLCLELPCASNWEQDADLIAWLSSLG